MAKITIFNVQRDITLKVHVNKPVMALMFCMSSHGGKHFCKVTDRWIDGQTSLAKSMSPNPEEGEVGDINITNMSSAELAQRGVYQNI